jgi:hypothetical protein
MTLEERRLLEAFLADLMRVPAIRKDRAAAAAIDSAFERQPNAAYLVVQRALLLQQALEAAQAETARLRERYGEPPEGEPRFLHGAASLGGTTARPAAVPSGAGAGFLGQAAATAVGVAGGAFLFQGLHDLLGVVPAAAAVPAEDALSPAALAEGEWHDDLTGADASDLAL